MSVINTNYLALVSQNNLTKSQNALGTAIERLSSGLRINSAKDDAAGQAIANRFTANIKGLTQAARNANDGISAAQTTEGALNEINNNLQRIRELSVQAANGSNSDSDLKSIQDEINQRLDEIDRVAKQTTFNGTHVLNSSETLKVQVGSQDSEVIDINLRAINRETLGLTKLNMESQFVSKNAAGQSNFTAYNPALNGLENPTAVSNTVKEAVSADWVEFNAFSGTQFINGASYDSLVVGDDNNLYAVVGTSADPANNSYFQVTLDAETQTLSVAVGSTAYATIGGVTTDPDAAFDPGTGGGYVRLDQVSLDMIPTATPSIDGGFYLENSAGGVGTQLWAQIGASYYRVSVAFTSGALTSMTVDMASGVSAGTWAGRGSALTSDTYLAAYGEAGVSMDYTAAAATLGVAATDLSMVKNDEGDTFVAVSDGAGGATYYAATYSSTTGVVTLTNGATPVNTEPNMDTVDGILTDGTNTLVQYAGKSGVYVQNVDGDNTTYYAAEISQGGTVSLIDAEGTITTTAADAEIMVDPLAALDRALQDVDSLRSELGAVQNRFESTIANLNNTVNNLSAARSRIEDADYAVEVSNMTRAQILQQAGTSVLAQANQVPQTVLSLLR